jgi:hypothetical protein
MRIKYVHILSITGKKRSNLVTIGQKSSKLHYIKTNQKTLVTIEITRAYFCGASRIQTGDLLTASQVFLLPILCPVPNS